MAVSKARVSVITVTRDLNKRNRIEFFHQCVASVHNQQYPNVEHIIVDGASTDGTQIVLEEYARKGWLKYISEPDSSVYEAMNKGIRMATGKYIAILNSDDYYHDRHAVEMSVRVLEKSNADFSYAPVKVVNPDGTQPDPWHYHERPIISDAFVHMPFSHQSMLVKRSTLQKMGLYDERYHYAGDYDLVLRLCLQKATCVFVPEAFLTYRLSGLSDQHSRESTAEVYAMMYEHFNKLAPVTMEQCKEIFAHEIARIPYDLAIKLKANKPYFDFDRYLEMSQKELELHRSNAKRLKRNPVVRGVRVMAAVGRNIAKQIAEQIRVGHKLFAKAKVTDMMELWHSQHIDAAFTYLPNKPQKCLIIGCNRGEECALLYQKGIRDISGIDVIQDLGKKFRNKYTKYYSGIAENMHMFKDNTFDLVFSFATFEHIHDIKTAYHEAVRVTKPGGIVYVFASPLWNSPYGHHYDNLYKGYPWIHLRYNKVKDLYAFCQKNSIPATEDQILYMMESGEFNRKSSMEYQQAGERLADKADILVNQLAQIDDDAKAQLDPTLLKKGYKKDDLFSIWHLLVVRKR